MTHLNKYLLLFLLSGLALFSSCEVEEITDPNNPSLGGVLQDASKAELQSLVSGLEARQRGYFTNATQMFGSFGREVWPYFGSDPRFPAEWLGQGITETYNDFFGSAGTYVTPYIAVKQANTLISSANNTNALSGNEANGYSGFAKTVKGYQLLWPLNQQYQNGIRIDVEDPLNPGPTLSYDNALQAIRDIMNDGYSDLQNAGSSFAFNLTSGFDGFSSPAGMGQVNRAIAARLALYAEDWQGALTALDNSFMDLDVTAATSDKMWMGPAHVYGNAPDINNPLFYPLDQSTSTILIVHPAVIEDMEEGDARMSKFAERVNNPASNSGISDSNGTPFPGNWQDARWASNTAPIPFIRNEELILIYAEANARLNNTSEAVSAINTVRTTWGLAAYTGATDTESLIEEILTQRRFSLWAEGGHRWLDLRRTNRLNADYIDLREGGSIFTQVARRFSEINWEEG